MSFLKYAQLFIPALVDLPVTVWDGKDETLKSFEEKFCFAPQIQPLYTENGIQSFFAQKEENRIYEIIDALDTRAIVVKINAQVVILGPYVVTQWNDIAAKVLMANCGVPSDQFIPYKLYRCSLPLNEGDTARSAASFVLENTVQKPNLIPICIDVPVSKAGTRFLHISERYNEVGDADERYEIEYQMMEAIRQGNALQVFQLRRISKNYMGNIRFDRNGLTNKIAFACAFRVLVRHAAVQAGLAPAFVDALSQEYAQKMHRAASEAQLGDLLREYVIVFCDAIRKRQKSNYSPYVKQAIQYMELHLNYPITIEDLCRLNNVTQHYFSQQFKKETGKTVKQYLMHMRCESAAELLKTSNLPIQIISQSVGYEDTNYFSRVFKSTMGISPQEYRKQKLFS